MKNKLFDALPWVAVPFTLFMLALYHFIPDQHVEYYPSNNIFGALYSGSSTSNAPDIEWLDDSQNGWRCDALKEETDYQFCGVNFLTRNKKNGEGRNLNNISSIKLKISYTGSSEKIRFVMRSFDPGYATVKDDNSLQYIYTEIKTSSLKNEPIDVYMTEFTVADWWIEQYDHKRTLVQPSFKNVTSIGFELSEEVFEGRHEITIDEITLIGPVFDESNYYLCILFIWMLVQFGYLFTRLSYVKNAVVHYQERGNELISQNKKLTNKADKYKKLSSKDPLTGIYNRRGFNDQADPFFAGHYAGAILLIDLDFFKNINDTFGHDAGDIVLKTVTQVIIDNVRKNDIVGRWGGEEFIVYVSDSFADSVLTLAEKLRLSIKELAIPEFPQISITTSIGFAIRMQDESFDDCFKRADIKLYSAKTSGRDQTQF
ncbi:GGDEF domain-containing protein [Algibacillus agarilyticus]|uniref:GGDEF domain-containing protein n=1 Tax=Algibacillus agarilyticus TaxID=2234133 RepID=UPI000DD0CD72|nr:GGDEF domain-containing protein [Algibacillus agarilyticus]